MTHQGLTLLLSGDEPRRAAAQVVASVPYGWVLHIRPPRGKRPSCTDLQLDWVEEIEQENYRRHAIPIPLAQQIADLCQLAKSAGGLFDHEYCGVSESALKKITDALSEDPVTLQEVMATTGMSKPTVTVGLRVLVERDIADRIDGRKTKWEYLLK